MIDRRMVFPGPWQAVWQEFEVPDEPGPGQILAEATYGMVNYGTLVAIFTGTHININNPAVAWPKFPHQPGGNLVAVVRAVAPDVQQWKPGDRVAFSGGYSRWHMLGPTAEVLPIPAAVSDVQAVVAAHSTISLNGIRLGNVAVGNTVVIFGQGVIGQYAQQYARIAGATTVVVVDPIEARLDIARRCGASVTLNPDKVDVEAEVSAITGGRGADVVIEATGAPPVIPVALRIAGWLGRVVLLGSSRGKVEIDPYNDIHRKGVTVVGAHAQTAASVANAYYPWTTGNNTIAAWGLVEDGRLHLEDLVSHQLKASENLDVFDRLARQREHYLGVVLDWRP
ncbi:MAG: zinc-dependent alcohol dehydrogenase [Anaerolineae bacterium]